LWPIHSRLDGQRSLASPDRVQSAFVSKGIRHILRGALPLAGLEVVGLLLALVTLPYLMRVLGPSGFGQYAFGVAACSVLTMLIDYGFNQLGPKAVARQTGLEDKGGGGLGALFWAIQSARLVVALLALPALWLVAVLVRATDEYSDVLPVFALAALSALLFPQWFLQGALRLRTLASALAAARCVSALATILLVHAPTHAPLAVALFAGTGSFAGILALADRQYRRSISWSQPRWADSRRWLREGRGLFGSTLAVATYSTGAPLVIGLMTNPAVLGLFSAGDKLRVAVQALLAAVGTSAFPRFARWIHVDRARGLAEARRLLMLQLALALIAVVVICVGAEPAIRLAVGPSFLAAVPVAQVLSLCIVCTAISNTLGIQVMLPLDMERSFTRILVASALFGLLATAWWSMAWQETGAAAAVLATEALVAGAMAYALRCRGVRLGAGST
jgi:O-antigen/teichoic acid export membrane protein